MLLGASYVQRVIHALNDHFLNLIVFIATKLFSPHNYPRIDSDQITNAQIPKLWIKRILLKSQYIGEESDMCKGELLEFTETLQYECENNLIFEAWHICGSNLKWLTNWPNLMQLWHKLILVPSSIAICERIFRKQNAIKSHSRNRLNLKTLDVVMWVSFCGLEVDAMDWASIFNIWRNMWDQRILTLDW